jgi:hypothetical protein
MEVVMKVKELKKLLEDADDEMDVAIGPYHLDYGNVMPCEKISFGGLFLDDKFKCVHTPEQMKEYVQVIDDFRARESDGLDTISAGIAAARDEASGTMSLVPFFFPETIVLWGE